MISKSTIDDYNRKRLANLIKEVSTLHGGEPEFDPRTGEVLGEFFLDEYIAEVLKEWSNDLPKAIACFSDLKLQAIGLKGVETKRVAVEKSQGHGAFRHHYERLEREKSGKCLATQGKDVSR